MFDALVDAGFICVEALASDSHVFFDNFSALDVHRRMLADAPRVSGYREAIEQVVKPGMTVLDAGTGTGVLACLAALAGASRVYAVDNSDALELAREVVSASGLDDVVTLIRGNFADAELPEQVDVIITETFGALAIAEGGFPDIADCAAYNLKSSGVVIPHQVSIWLAAVTHPTVADEALGAFADLGGVRLDALRPSAMHRAITLQLNPDHLGIPARAATLDMGTDDGVVHAQLTLDVAPNTEVYGFAAWFDLHMSPGVELSTGPDAPATHWQQVYLPTEHFLAQGPIAMSLHIEPASDDSRGLLVRSQFDGQTVAHRVR